MRKTGVIASQLVYGHNPLNITPSLKASLNAFHMRGLISILNTEHNFHSHISNTEVIKQMNPLLYQAEHRDTSWEQCKIDRELKGDNYKCIKLVGNITLDCQMALLGHAIRREPN